MHSQSPVLAWSNKWRRRNRRNVVCDLNKCTQTAWWYFIFKNSQLAMLYQTAADCRLPRSTLDPLWCQLLSEYGAGPDLKSLLGHGGGLSVFASCSPKSRVLTCRVQGLCWGITVWWREFVLQTKNICLIRNLFGRLLKHLDSKVH